LALFAPVGAAQASDQLLYFEAQGIAGYSTEIKKTVFYSMNPDAAMQKPSLGFHYLKRLSGKVGDIATFALQGHDENLMLMDEFMSSSQSSSSSGGFQK
jgi:hypothetical protein